MKFSRECVEIENVFVLGNTLKCAKCTLSAARVQRTKEIHNLSINERNRYLCCTPTGKTDARAPYWEQILVSCGQESVN